MVIDLWYNDKPEDVTKVTCSFSDTDCIYRGNLYNGNRIIGDFSSRDSVEIEDTFNVKFQ